MKTISTILSKISLSSGLAVALAFAVWSPSAARATEHEMGSHDMMQMQHITTQVQAEALLPGDTMSMACSKCKVVIVQTVTNDKSHVKMMTVGEKMMCTGGCGGTVEVVATGKGKGKDAEVVHVCSNCGDDAMFCAATKPGSGAMNGMGKMKP